MLDTRNEPLDKIIYRTKICLGPVRICLAKFREWTQMDVYDHNQAYYNILLHTYVEIAREKNGTEQA